MKTPPALLAWLSIPLAGAGGYFARLNTLPPSSSAAPASHRPPALSTVRTAAAQQASALIPGWTTRLEKATVADLPGLYAEILALPTYTEREQTLRLLCARWAELDPAGGLAFLTSADKKDVGDTPRSCLLKEWALLDVDAAFASVQALGAETPSMLEEIGPDLLREAPETFWLWFKKARVPLPTGESTAWTRLAGAHFEEMNALALEMLDAWTTETVTGKKKTSYSVKPQSLFRTLGAALAGKDPAGALVWAAAMPYEARSAALGGALGALATSHPQLALEALATRNKELANPSEKETGDIREAFTLACETMVKQDPVAGLAWMRAHAGEFKDMPVEISRNFSKVLSAGLDTGSLTVEAAFAQVTRATDVSSESKKDILATMWKGLAPERLTVAASWLKGQPAGGDRSIALVRVLQAWDKSDSTAARAFASGLNDPTVERDFYLLLATRAGFGPTATVVARTAGVLEGIPPTYRADLAAEMIQSRYGRGTGRSTDPFAAPGFGEDQVPHGFEGPTLASPLHDLPPSASTTQAVETVSNLWARTDPHSALDWAATLTDAGTRKAATGSAIEGWAGEDAWGASQWITRQPAGETRDTAASHLASALSTEEPDSAWVWAASIADPATRLEAQSAVLTNWQTTAPDQARAALEALAPTLPPASHQQLRDSLEKKPAAK